MGAPLLIMWFTNNCCICCTWRCGIPSSRACKCGGSNCTGRPANTIHNTCPRQISFGVLSLLHSLCLTINSSTPTVTYLVADPTPSAETPLLHPGWAWQSCAKRNCLRATQRSAVEAAGKQVRVTRRMLNFEVEQHWRLRLEDCPWSAGLSCDAGSEEHLLAEPTAVGPEVLSIGLASLLLLTKCSRTDSSSFAHLAVH